MPQQRRYIVPISFGSGRFAPLAFLSPPPLGVFYFPRCGVRGVRGYQSRLPPLAADSLCDMSLGALLLRLLLLLLLRIIKQRQQRSHAFAQAPPGKRCGAFSSRCIVDNVVFVAPVEELGDFPSHLSWSSPPSTTPSLPPRIPHSHTGPLSAVPVPGLGVACAEAGATVGAFRGTCRWDKGPRVLGLKTD
ncbi:unnamed protein product [Pleuronectes platessa]|uniref:Uncharacterized protein n=1 Tax=Pleuronectes platessa TaxID=8262 RepID=A0A9N7VRN7_PLEPL|nr:unnamed protein product [Pleuronectes platessa]